MVFLAVWLVLWSAGVAFVQSMILGLGEGGLLADGGGLLRLLPVVFLVIHGGSEVFVQRSASMAIAKRAQRPSQVVLTQDVGGRQVSWRRGHPTVVQWLATYVVPVCTLLILISPLGYAVAGQESLATLAVAGLLAVAWVGILAWLWVPTWRAQARSTDRLTVRVHPHGLELEIDGTIEDQRLAFARPSVEILATGGGGYRLRDGETTWRGQVPPQAAELLDEARSAFEAVKVAPGGEVPEALRALLGDARQGDRSREPTRG